MSALSHAGPFVADYYLDLTDGQPLPTLRRTPKYENPHPWLFMTAAALIWAGRSVSVCVEFRTFWPFVEPLRLLG